MKHRETPDYRAQEAAITAFVQACAKARDLLPPMIELNETQRRVVLGAALIGLSNADLPYYSRAIRLLLGERDQVIDGVLTMVDRI